MSKLTELLGSSFRFRSKLISQIFFILIKLFIYLISAARMLYDTLTKGPDGLNEKRGQRKGCGSAARNL